MRYRFVAVHLNHSKFGPVVYFRRQRIEKARGRHRVKTPPPWMWTGSGCRWRINPAWVNAEYRNEWVPLMKGYKVDFSNGDLMEGLKR